MVAKFGPAKCSYHLFFRGIQGRSQEFQKGVSINGRMSIKQGSVGVQFQMLSSHAHVHFEFNTFLPNKIISLYS